MAFYPQFQDQNNQNERTVKTKRPRYRRQRRRPQRRPRSPSESSSSSTLDTASVSSTGSHNDSFSRAHHQNQQKHNHPITEVESLSSSEEQQSSQGQYVALDCEMVGVGQHGKESALARVTIIDFHGNILMDQMVKQEREVTDFRTAVSGITPEIIAHAQMDLQTCRMQVEELLKGKVLVGHALKNDLRALGVSHPWYMTRDTAKYEPFMKVRFDDGILWPRGLKDLCNEKLNRQVQVPGKPHCPLEDALAALDLYRLVQHKWEKTMEYKLNRTRAIEQQKQSQR